MSIRTAARPVDNNRRFLTRQQIREIKRRYQRIYQLPPDQEVFKWAEDNIRFLTLPTPYPGPYSTTMTPYVRGPLEAYRDKSVHEITLCWGSQTAKTTTIMIGLAWMIRNNPGPMVWVFPNEKLARAFSVNRWQKMIEDNPILRSLLPEEARKIKILEQPFKNALLIFTGSNSAANLASNPAPIVIMDEVDKLAESSMKEANAVELAEQRAKFFWKSRKIILTSTPTIPEAPIWDRYLSGDQQRYFLACPKCRDLMLPILSKDKTVMEPVGCETELTWDPDAKRSDRWDYKRVRETAHYPCPHCGFEVFDHHRTMMLRDGIWQPTAEPENEWQRSFHLSSLYAPTIPAGDIAVEFIVKSHSPEGLRGFMNGTLAEPWQNQDTLNDRTERIVNLETDPEPGKPIARIITGDYQQKDNHWFVCRDWFMGGHSRLVEWGKWDNWDEIEGIRHRLETNPDLTGVDNGYDTAEVNRNSFERGYFVLRGDDKESWPKPIFKKVRGRKKKVGTTYVPFTTTKRDPYIGTARQGKKTLTELRWSNPTIKDILARFRDAEESPVKWEIPELWATEEYFRHLNGELLETQFNKNTGKIKRFWKKRSERWPNHLLDCECEQIAVAVHLGILKLSDEALQEILDQLKQQAEAAGENKPTDDDEQES